MFTGQTYLDPRARRPAIDWLVGAVLLGIILLMVWFVWLRPPEVEGEPSGAARSRVWYLATYGSDPATIDRILAATDCPTLAAAFAEGSDAFREPETTEAENRAAVGVMAAAADRMNEVGCPIE